MSKDLELRLKLTADNQGVSGVVRETRQEVAGLRNSLDSNAGAARNNAKNLDGLRTAGEEANRMFKLQKNALQQVGYQIQDFVVQVGAGQSAFVALGQQGSQMLSILGPGGVLAGAVLAIGSIIGGTLVRTLGEAEEAIAEVDTSLKGLIDRINELTERQARYAISELEKQREKLNAVGSEANSTRARIEFLQRQLAMFPSSKNAASWRTELEKLESNSDTFAQETDRISQQIAALEQRIADINSGTATWNEQQRRAADEVKSLNEQLGLQILAMEKGERAAALARLEKLAAHATDKAALDTARQLTNQLHDLIDAEEKRKKAQRESAEEAQKLERAQQELNAVLDRIDPDGALGRRLEADKKVIQTALEKGLIDDATAKKLVDQADITAKQAASRFQNAFNDAAKTVSQSLQNAIAAGEWDSVGEAVGNAIGATAAAIIGDRITKSLAVGVTKDSSLMQQATAAFAGPFVGALIGGVIGLAVREIGDYFSDDWDPTAKRQASQGAGTVLGDIRAKSESIRRAVEGSESGIGQLVGLNQSMLEALRSLQAGVSGASDRVAQGVAGININAPDVMSGRDVFKFAAGGDIPLMGVSGLLGAVGSLAFDFFDTMGEILTIGLLDLDELLGGKAKKRDEGIQIIGGYISDLIDETIVNAYATFRVKKHFLDDYDTKESVERIGGDVERQFALVFASIYESVSAGAAALGMAPDQVQAAMDQFVVKTQKLSLEGLSVDEQRRELEAYFGTVFDGLAATVVPFLSEFQHAGEGLGETLARVANYTAITQEAVDRLGVQFRDLAGRDLVEASERLMEAAGGVEAFIRSMESFLDNFATDAQKFELAQSDLVRALEQAGLQLPATRDGYYALLQAQDASTEAGAQNIATLLKLQGIADRYYRLLEESVEEVMRAQQDRVADLRRVYDALDNAMGRVFSGSVAAEAQRQGALAYLQKMAASGTVSYSREFSDALAAATNISMSSYATFADYMRDSAETGALIQRLQDITEDQISVEEQVLIAIEDGNQAVIAQLERVNQQLASRSAIVSAPSSSVQVMPAYGRSDTELLSEIQRLRAELAASQQAIARHTAKTARLLERIELDGLEIRTS